MLEDIQKTLWATADKRHKQTAKLGEQIANGAELCALITPKLGSLSYGS